MILFKHLKNRFGALFMGGIPYLAALMTMLPFGLFAQGKTITGTVVAVPGHLGRSIYQYHRLN